MQTVYSTKPDRRLLAGQATQPARQSAPNHHASTPISKPPWTDGEGLPKGRFLRRSEHDRPVCVRELRLPSAELPREFNDSVGVHCRRCGEELGTRIGITKAL